MKYIFQISDYPEDYLHCNEEDQELLALFKVGTKPHKKEKYGYRKRTGPSKLEVKLPLIEEKINLVVNWTLFSACLFISLHSYLI